MLPAAPAASWPMPASARLRGAPIASGHSSLLSLSPLRGWGRGAGSCLTFPRGSQSQANPTLCLQVTPFPEAYREALHGYKISEQDTDVRANIRPACPPSAPCRCPSCPCGETCAERSCAARVGPGAAPGVVCAPRGLCPPLSLAAWACPMSRFGQCHPGQGCNESRRLENLPRTIH